MQNPVNGSNGRHVTGNGMSFKQVDKFPLSWIAADCRPTGRSAAKNALYTCKRTLHQK